MPFDINTSDIYLFVQKFSIVIKISVTQTLAPPCYIQLATWDILFFHPA